MKLNGTVSLLNIGVVLEIFRFTYNMLLYNIYYGWLSNEVETREFLNVSPPFAYMGKRQYTSILFRSVVGLMRLHI